ncbi:MAG: hypothetical protein F6K56_03790 [Moorea sp. SIO3G5]|nr:hypothetical protein [Moorena sp. SIO3G5]
MVIGLLFPIIHYPLPITHYLLPERSRIRSYHVNRQYESKLVCRNTEMFPTNYLCLPLSRMGAGILSDCMVKPGGKLTEEWILWELPQAKTPRFQTGSEVTARIGQPLWLVGYA